MKNVKKAADAIREELKEPLPDHTPTKENKVATKKKSKKVSKKKSKKVSKKVTKKNAKKATAKKAKSKKTEDGGVTLAALADEAGISGQKARKKLRDAEIERAEGSRWSWEEGSKELKKVRKALGL